MTRKTTLARLAAAAMAVAWTAGARAAAPTQKADATPLKGEIAVGEIFSIKLPCSPTTGYQWALKSINRKIAVPTGPAEFQQSPTAPGAVGVGGDCVIGIKGVKAGKTKAVLVYRRSWEKKVEPAKTLTAEIKVLPNVIK